MEREKSRLDAFAFAQANAVIGTIASQTQISIVFFTANVPRESKDLEVIMFPILSPFLPPDPTPLEVFAAAVTP